MPIFSHVRIVGVLLSIVLIACNKKDWKEYQETTIYRDAYGVPHIHGKTDENVAYGLAWASCEDDFNTIQEQMLAIRGRLGEIKGRPGLIADFGILFMGLAEYAQEHYRSNLSPKVLDIIDSYVAGINHFAQRYPEEVLHKGIFPIVPSDVVAGYMLGLVEISGASGDLQKIMNGEIIRELKSNFPKGSNAIAIAKDKTEEGQTFLAINSHQPLEGWYSWYEAHLISDEGTNILGGTFPGGVTIFHGVNESLGWAHTVNHADFSDVFRLEMHPHKPLHYSIDGEWKKLKKKHLWAWMKLAGPIRIPIRRTIYHSLYGITFKTDDGYFAWKFVAGEAVKAIDQWYGMNRSTNIEEFINALKIQGIPCTNIVYADVEGNIFYVSNGTIPLRNGSYNWREVLPGNTSATLWNGRYWPLDSLPQVLNPNSGIVFNTNNSPFVSTIDSDGPKPTATTPLMGYLPDSLNNNRSQRFLDLTSELDKISWEAFKDIKYDLQYPDSMSQPHMMNQGLVLQLDHTAYPDLATEIQLLNNWDRKTDVNNVTAAFFFHVRSELNNILAEGGSLRNGTRINEDQCITAIRRAKTLMESRYGQIQFPLGDIQRHTRGNLNYPIGGGPDVLAAIYTRRQEDNTYRAISGESYILMARFDSLTGVQLESVHAYGSSAEPLSPHYGDQMELFVKQELKPMTLSLEKIMDEALKEYHPLILK